MAEYDCCVFRFLFEFWPASKISGQDFSNFTLDNPDKWRQNKTNEFNVIYPAVSNHHLHR